MFKKWSTFYFTVKKQHDVNEKSIANVMGFCLIMSAVFDFSILRFWTLAMRLEVEHSKVENHYKRESYVEVLVYFYS